MKYIMFIHLAEIQANPNSAYASMKQVFKKPSFRCRRKTGGHGENLLKQAWTGNQMHKCRDQESNLGLIGAKREKIRYTTGCIHFKKEILQETFLNSQIFCLKLHFWEISKNLIFWCLNFWTRVKKEYFLTKITKNLPKSSHIYQRKIFLYFFD